MGIDYRPDHGFRIPRPDLSIKIGTPNACDRCHVDKTSGWSDKTITKWYGPGRRAHYGTIIDAGRKMRPEARGDLIRLGGDPLYPVIVRATALALLAAYPGEDTARAFEPALMDDEALIRRTAVDGLQLPGHKALAERLGPLLYDPVKAVRIEAARRLAGEPAKHLNADQKKVFQTVLREYESAMAYSADFAFGRYNLGNLYAALNRTEEAIRNYRAAIKIDGLLPHPKVNLAMLYNKNGENDEAEALLRDVITAHPDMHEIAYSLGLLLVEMKKYDQAVFYLEQAAEGMPDRARVHYNLGLLLGFQRRYAQAEAALLKALEIEPDSMDYLYAVADYYLKTGKLKKAKGIAERLVAKYPGHRIGHELMGIIERNLQK
jgi:tetratricopeptide (TPR) repeat protein